MTIYTYPLVVVEVPHQRQPTAYTVPDLTSLRDLACRAWDRDGNAGDPPGDADVDGCLEVLGDDLSAILAWPLDAAYREALGYVGHQSLAVRAAVDGLLLREMWAVTEGAALDAIDAREAVTDDYDCPILYRDDATGDWYACDNDDLPLLRLLLGDERARQARGGDEWDYPTAYTEWCQRTSHELATPEQIAEIGGDA